MTKEELSQVRNLKNEIKLLKEQKAEIRQRMSGMSTPHSVQASGKCEPYQLHNITIQGVARSETDAYIEADDKREKIALDLAERERQCLDEYDRINSFVSTVQDSEMRQILTLYYLKGLTWQQVAFKIGENDESYPRRKCTQFLKLAEIADS
ncbi:hypothetical protein [Caproiciproducens faecalis]|uniref:DUF1492 domain-containing protein n=1 Tax=Caproiciproducens faecalis TaxID=2820301 RepID=A0ABS7DSB2_9FIRM|nr:hypothetical protein [Caproiciproducens faecalis]MBW7573902.1 hypothetical protein [Caproiciproducens faecalis]